DFGAGYRAHHVAGTKPDLLRLQVTRQVIADPSRRSAKLAVELALLFELKEQLVGIGHRSRELLDLAAGEQPRILAPHRHRAGWIDRRDLVALAHVRQERIQVRARLLLREGDVAAVDRRHPAAILLWTRELASAAAKDLDRRLARSGIVVIDEAGRKEHDFGAW